MRALWLVGWITWLAVIGWAGRGTWYTSTSTTLRIRRLSAADECRSVEKRWRWLFDPGRLLGCGLAPSLLLGMSADQVGWPRVASSRLYDWPAAVVRFLSASRSARVRVSSYPAVLIRNVHFVTIYGSLCGLGSVGYSRFILVYLRTAAVATASKFILGVSRCCHSR